MRFVKYVILAFALAAAAGSVSATEAVTPQFSSTGTPFSCTIGSGTAGNLVCKTAPGAGLYMYVTDIVISNTGAAQLHTISYAPSSCASGTTAIVSTAVPAGTSVVIQLRTPIKIPANQILCCNLGGGAQAHCTASGYLAPY